jgi:hypothetical protein
MKKPIQPLTLFLRTTGGDKYLQLRFAGLLSNEMSLERQRQFLGLTSLLASPAPLRVAIFADESGSWDWAKEWTDALEDLEGGLELRFKGHEVRHGR